MNSANKNRVVSEIGMGAAGAAAIVGADAVKNPQRYDAISTPLINTMDAMKNIPTHISNNADAYLAGAEIGGVGLASIASGVQGTRNRVGKIFLPGDKKQSAKNALEATGISTRSALVNLGAAGWGGIALAPIGLAPVGAGIGYGAGMTLNYLANRNIEMSPDLIERIIVVVKDLPYKTEPDFVDHVNNMLSATKYGEFDKARSDYLKKIKEKKLHKKLYSNKKKLDKYVTGLRSKVNTMKVFHTAVTKAQDIISTPPSPFSSTDLTNSNNYKQLNSSNTDEALTTLPIYLKAIPGFVQMKSASDITAFTAGKENFEKLLLKRKYYPDCKDGSGSFNANKLNEKINNLTTEVKDLSQYYSSDFEKVEKLIKI
jgi:hypothetical protein